MPLADPTSKLTLTSDDQSTSEDEGVQIGKLTWARQGKGCKTCEQLASQISVWHGEEVFRITDETCDQLAELGKILLELTKDEESRIAVVGRTRGNSKLTREAAERFDDSVKKLRGYVPSSPAQLSKVEGEAEGSIETRRREPQVIPGGQLAAMVAERAAEGDLLTRPPESWYFLRDPIEFLEEQQMGSTGATAPQPLTRRRSRARTRRSKSGATQFTWNDRLHKFDGKL